MISAMMTHSASDLAWQWREQRSARRLELPASPSDSFVADLAEVVDLRQGRCDSGCRWRRLLDWGKWRRSSGNLTEETTQRLGPASLKLGERRAPTRSLAATAWRWPTWSGLWQSSSLAEQWRSGRRRGGAALRRMMALDGSRDGGCAWLDDRRRFKLVRDDEDGARRQRVARGRRTRLAPSRLKEVVGRGGGSVRWMGMAARCSEQQCCCRNGEGLSASNAAHGDKLVIVVGCRVRCGLQVDGDALCVGPGVKRGGGRQVCPAATISLI
jgi:hypothetical protein